MGYPYNFGSLAEVLETGSEVFQGTFEIAKDGLIAAGEAIEGTTGQFIKFVANTGSGAAGSSAVAESSTLAVVTATETVTEAGTVTTLVPAAAISGASLGEIILGSLPFFGLAAVGADAAVKIVHQIEDYWDGDFSHSWRDQTGLYDEIARRVRLYIDKDGKTYVDGTTLEIIGDALNSLGAFEEAGYTTTDLPLFTILKLDCLNYSNSREFFKLKYVELAPENKKEVVGRAVDVLFDYLYSTIGILPNTNNLLVMTCDSYFSSIHLYFHQAESYSFSKYELQYINTGVLAPSGNKVTGSFYDGTTLAQHSIYNIYTYGMSSGNPGATHNVTSVQNFAYPGGAYIYDNAVSKSEGYESVKQIGIFPRIAEGLIKFATSKIGIDTNAYSPEVVVPKPIEYPNALPETTPVIYPITIPEILPSGLPKPIPQTDAQAGVYPVPDINPIIQAIIDNLPVTPQPTPPAPQPVPKPQDIPVDLPVPPIPSTGIPGTGLVALYNPTQSQLASFSRWLWSDDFIENIKKLFQDPMQAIIGLHVIYATPSRGSSATIQCGYLDSGVTSRTVSSQYINIACGAIKLNKYFDSILDYAPYTKVQCFLPFIGVVDLDTNEVMNSTINITYRIDVLTGACLAQISISRSDFGAVLYTFAGNCAVQMPITGGNYSSIIANTIGVAASVGATIASGGALAPVAVSGAATAVANSHFNVAHSGSIGSNAGAMGGKIPYIIITRPKPYEATNFTSFYGIPSNTTVKLSSCIGFTRVKEVHVENITGATSDELNEIEAILKDGVII